MPERSKVHRVLRSSCTFIFTLILSQMAAAQDRSVTLEISNVKSSSGELLIAVYDSETSYQDITQAIRAIEVDARSPITRLEVTLPAIQLAIVVLHDQNGNKQCDLNFFGIPKEPFGFSNNARPVFSSPSFNDVKINIGESTKMSISLID